MATVDLAPHSGPNRGPLEPKQKNLEALHQENKQLRKLVIELSKLVVKYVMQRDSPSAT
jgi:hypothetical protein